MHTLDLSVKMPERADDTMQMGATGLKLFSECAATRGLVLTEKLIGPATAHYTVTLLKGFNRPSQACPPAIQLHGCCHTACGIHGSHPLKVVFVGRDAGVDRRDECKL